MPDYEYERVVVTTCSTVCTPDNHNHALYVMSTVLQSTAVEYNEGLGQGQHTRIVQPDELYIQYMTGKCIPVLTNGIPSQRNTNPVQTGSRPNGIQTPSKRDLL